MKVILKDYVRKLGDVGDVVNVKDGYARNYLFPQDVAIPATDNNLKRIENIRARHQEQHKHLIAGFSETAERVNGKTITITARLNEEGRLYGSISEREIAAALNDACGTAVDPAHIDIGGHFKEPGTYRVHLRFSVGLGADIEVIVVGEGAPTVEAAAAPSSRQAPREEASDDTEADDDQEEA